MKLHQQLHRAFFSYQLPLKSEPKQFHVPPRSIIYLSILYLNFVLKMYQETASRCAVYCCSVCSVAGPVVVWGRRCSPVTWPGSSTAQHQQQLTGSQMVKSADTGPPSTTARREVPWLLYRDMLLGFMTDSRHSRNGNGRQDICAILRFLMTEAMERICNC